MEACADHRSNGVYTVPAGRRKRMRGMERGWRSASWLVVWWGVGDGRRSVVEWCVMMRELLLLQLMLLPKPRMSATVADGAQFQPHYQLTQNYNRAEMSCNTCNRHRSSSSSVTSQYVLKPSLVELSVPFR